jgi:hypothetical protein
VYMRGLMYEPLVRLSDIITWGNNLSHRVSEKFQSVLLSPVMK